MKVLVTAVDEGGFAAAGRKLGLSRVQVSRLVGALEDHLGAQLLKRTTRTMALTEAGLAFVERARSLVSQFEEAQAAAGEAADDLRGLLQVNAPVTFGVSHVAPAVGEFMKLHPSVTFSLILNDRYVDPHEEGFDVALHIGEAQPTSLVDRKISPVRRLMCASPGYLEAHGRPRTLGDLTNHGLLHHGPMANDMHWPVRRPDGGGPLPVSPQLCSNNGDVLKLACLAGRGITLLPAFIVTDELASGTLVPVLEGFEPLPVALYAVYSPGRHRPAKTKAFVDFLTARFQKRPPGGPV